jgi:hypothetical protein
MFEDISNFVRPRSKARNNYLMPKASGSTVPLPVVDLVDRSSALKVAVLLHVHAQVVAAHYYIIRAAPRAFGLS